MLSLVDITTDPYFNLAAEEYLLTSFRQPIFRLWRNTPSVIVGKNQNTIAEVNSSFVRENNIPVVRRLSGGGAVFHDLGNINYTFIENRVYGEDTSSMFRRFTSPIIQALRDIGVDASLQGRNDLLIDGGKFSGNAICLHNGRLLQHGTLLFNSSLEKLSGALNSRPEKFLGKNVKSNISRVTNISEHLKTPMNVTDFMEYLASFIPSAFKKEGIDITPYTYSEADIAAITSLRNTKYITRKWNWGETANYTFQNTIKSPCGLIELSLNIDKGIISDCKIMGDFFFTRAIEEFENALVGMPHTYDDIYCLISNQPLKDFFGAIDSSDLISLFFPE